MTTFLARTCGLVGVIVALSAPLHAQTGTFDIYWVDVEGGAATLAIAPDGTSLLVDTGYPGNDDRDARRIFQTAQAAGLTRIDHLVISHYHTDHVGGLEALARLMPIGRCYDHGGSTEPANQRWVEAYLRVCADTRTVLSPGDRIPLGDVSVDVVASDMRLIAEPINGGGPNPRCDGAEQRSPASPENQRSIGALFTYGRFTFLDLADFSWAMELELSCPTNLVGEVSLYQTSRHGAWDDAGAPAHLFALAPQVIIVNNGPRKGLGGTSPGYDEVTTRHYERMTRSPGIEGIWQGHRSLFDPAPESNAAEEMIANLEDTDDCEGHWLRASVTPDGTFTVTNGRNGHQRRYTAR